MTILKIWYSWIVQ